VAYTASRKLVFSELHSLAALLQADARPWVSGTMQTTRYLDSSELNMWGPYCAYGPGASMRLGRVRAMPYGSESNSWMCMARWCEAPIRFQDFSRGDLVLGPYAECCLHVCGVIIAWSIRGIAYYSCCAIRHRLQLERPPCQSADAWSDDCKKANRIFVPSCDIR